MNLIKDNKGYSLIELLVSISIIGLISGIMIANYRTGGASDELNMAAQDMISEIRKVQGYALSYKEFEGVFEPDGGWGIRFSNDVSLNSNLLIFYDTDNNGKNVSGEIYLEKPIGNNVFVSDIIFDGVSTPDTYFWAIYYPPDPIIMLRGDDSATAAVFDYGDINTSVDEVEIVLSHINGGTKIIKLNKFGLIDVNAN